MLLSPANYSRVGIYHGSELLKRREDESARDFAQRKVTHENAQMRERKTHPAPCQLQFIPARTQISVMVANEAFGMDIDRQHIPGEIRAMADGDA